MLKRMAAAVKPASTTLAVQRQLCVDGSNNLRMEWFSAISEPTCIKLFAGQWAVAKTSSTTIDLWAEIVAPLLRKKRGNHFLDKLPQLAPEAFFASESQLRHGMPPVNEFFATIGVTGTAAGSLASVLTTCHGHAVTLDAWPHSFASAQQAAQALLIRAGQRCFEDAGAAWRLMLSTPLEQAAKPSEFAPASNGVHAILTQLQEIIDKVEHEIELADLNSAAGSFVSTVPTAPYAGSMAGSVISYGSLGPSASQVGAPTSTVASALAQSSISGSSALSGVIGEPACNADLLSEWGCATCDLQPEGNGFWFGNIYSGPSDASHVVPQNTCPATFAPNRHSQHKYCIYTPGACSHPPLPGVPLTTRVGGPATAPPQKGKGARGKGKGAKGKGGRGDSRGRGRGAISKRKVTFPRQQ